MWRLWTGSARKPRLLASTLFDSWQEALLFRTLATLRTDVRVFDTVEELRWHGERPGFATAYGWILRDEQAMARGSS